MSMLHYDEYERCATCGRDCQSRDECADNVAIQRQAKQEAGERMAALEQAASARADVMFGRALTREESK